jgi:hypothetical protein
MAVSTIKNRKIYRNGPRFMITLPRDWVNARIKEQNITEEEFCTRGVEIKTRGRELIIGLR